MTKPQVCWYRHNHENRNDLLRYGLMQLHVKGLISYIEKDLKCATQAGFSNNVTEKEHRHLSFLTVQAGQLLKKVMVDNEDSFIHLSELVQEFDIYFTAAYNSDIYQRNKVPDGYPWQTENDLQWYREKVTDIIDRLGNQFCKIKPFIPIGPNLGFIGRTSLFTNKLNNLIHRFYKLSNGNIYWQPNYKMFNKRYAELLAFRNSVLKYDVILKDTLWGWPLHRINLHRQLQRLASRFNIKAELNWHGSSAEDGSDKLALNKTDFPIKTGNEIVNYEEMLSESKLSVFASGFHWGWRNIMTFSFMVGIPVLIDEPLLEPYFNLSEFRVYFNTGTDWDAIEDILKDISPGKWEQIKRHNQGVYDRYLDPAAVAKYFLTSTGVACT